MGGHSTQSGNMKKRLTKVRIQKKLIDSGRVTVLRWVNEAEVHLASGIQRSAAANQFLGVSSSMYVWKLSTMRCWKEIILLKMRFALMFTMCAGKEKHACNLRRLPKVSKKKSSAKHRDFPYIYLFYLCMPLLSRH